MEIMTETAVETPMQPTPAAAPVETSQGGAGDPSLAEQLFPGAKLAESGDTPQVENVADQTPRPDRKGALHDQILNNTPTNPDELRRTLQAYQEQGGDLADFQSNPDLEAPILELQNRQAQQEQFKHDFADILANQLQPGDPQAAQWIEDNVHAYAFGYEDVPDTLLTPEQRANLNPEVLKMFEAAELKVFQEVALRAEARGLEFAQRILSDENAPAALRAEAEEYAKAVLIDSKKLLTEAGASEDQMLALQKQAEALGFDLSVIEAEADQLLLDADEAVAEVTTDENGFDVLNFLGLKDQDGNLRKGKAALFATAAFLFIMSDQLISKFSGQRAMIPMLLEGVMDVAGHVDKHQQMTKLKTDNPELYAYYERMGYMHENKLIDWLMEQAQQRFGNPQEEATT